MLKRLRKLFGSANKQDEPTTPSAAAERPSPSAASGIPAQVPVHHGPDVVHRPIPESDLDPDAVRIIRRLVRFDHAAYLVGGCVRDLLLERTPKDFDIGTSATPRQVKRSFSNCRIIGRRFRLAHVYFQNGKIIEVATFRARDLQVDAGDEVAEVAEDSDDLMIRDDNVFGSPEQDAVRRDFTINQLFYDVESGNVLDHADGLGDLRRRLVRTIGDPEVRFREDPIRILRAIKFAARLDFEIEPETREALLRTRNEIRKAATPRILEEFNRFCRGGAGRRSFELMFETGVFGVVLPELEPHYATPGREERELLLALLGDLDARAETAAIATGEILACLLAPVVLPELGLDHPGPGDAGRSGPSPRDVVDAQLRPIALRLRISRRDQEHCRQAILTLQRLVSAKAMRRSARAAILRRPSFPDALFLLRTLADRRGGAYGEAFTLWSDLDATLAPRQADPASAPSPAPAGSPSGTQGGRRRRRGGRGRRGGGGSPRPPSMADVAPKAAPETAPKGARPQAAPEPKLPPVWDDNYFFAALPTVPELQGDDAGADRYGARDLAVAKQVVVVAEDPSEASAASGAVRNPAPRKRRRSRRGRGRSGGGPPPPAEPGD